MARQSRLLLALALPSALIACAGSTGTGPDDGGEPPPEEGHAFAYAPPSGAPSIQALAVRGNFNAWGETAMTRRDDGVWRAYVDLADGTHRYKYFVNGAWIDDMCHSRTWGHAEDGYAVDPSAEGCVDDGYGGRNAVVTVGAVPLDFHHAADDPVFLSVSGGRLAVRFRARTGPVVSATVRSGADTASAHPQLEVGIHTLWRASLPATATSYSVAVETPDSTAVFGPYTVPADPFVSVPWAERGVAYQVFPDRFWNGDPANDSLGPATDEYHFRDPAVAIPPPVLTEAWDGPVLESHCCHQYFGGDLQGVIDRLDHLEGLGVTAVYLNPIFAAGSVHGYDTFRYTEVAPNYGDSTVLRSLVDAAHARGIRLIWDYVPNHVGIGHWAFQDALTLGEASDYWDWFEFHVPPDSIQAGNGSHYAAWWGFGSLPELETTHPDVLEHLLGVAETWTAFGLDGIRVDVPNEIENRAEFFGAWRERVKRLDPDVYLVGEIWERDASWLRGDRFDALMNYPLGHGVVAPFARGDLDGVGAARAMAALYAAYPEAAAGMMFNVVATHDTERILTRLGGGELGATPPPATLQRQRLAAALLFALPGMPVTFQGDECAQLGGSEGRHTARYPVQWDRCDAGMVDHYALLGRLKGDLDGLASPVFRAFPAPPSLLAFLRGEPGPGEVLALFNNTAGSVDLELPDGRWTDAVTGESFTGTAATAGMGWRYLIGG
ncbi:MAG: alpha-amylase family glycosyl hydrolase [Gemmatimonadota bacterium]